MTGIPQSQLDARACVLSLPEILFAIFEIVAKLRRNNAKTAYVIAPLACVCRTWLAPASRILWRSQSPWVLINLVPSWKKFICDAKFPLREGQQRTLEEIEDLIDRIPWRNHPEEFDWRSWGKHLLPRDYDRLIFYQEYILTMEIVLRNNHGPQIIMDALINAPNSPFRTGSFPSFPNLFEVHCSTYRSSNDTSYQKASLLVLSFLSTHASQIRHLTFNNGLIKKLLPLADSRLPLFLSQLVCLESIELPFVLSPLLAVCFEALSKLEHLSSLRTCSAWNASPIIGQESAGFNPMLCKGSFPALRSLDLYGELEVITRFFEMDYAPSELRTLIVHTTTPSTPQSMMEAFHAITAKCEHLQCFHCRCNTSDPQVLADGSIVITYPMLRTLEHLDCMEEFELDIPFGLDLTDSGIVNIVSRWRLLRVFKLVATLGGSKGGLKPTLNVLTQLAECCPNLRELELSVSFRLKIEENVSLFPTLCQLTIHPWIVDDLGDQNLVHLWDVDYASFLTSTCPLSCRIDLTKPRPVGDLDWETMQEAESRCNEIRMLINEKQRRGLVEKNRELERTIRRLKGLLGNRSGHEG